MMMRKSGGGVILNAGSVAGIRRRRAYPRKPQEVHCDDPLGRLARPNDVAGAALYLASDVAEWISGVEFPVDGARTV